MKIQAILFLLIPLLMFTMAKAQLSDSLEIVADTARNEVRVKALNELFREWLPSDPLKATDYAREALSYATETGDRKGLAAAYNNLGVAYRMQGALDKSLEYYITSLKIYEELNNKEGIASTRNNISTIYSMKRDFPEAIKYLEQSHKIFLEMNDTAKIIGSLNNLGNLHAELQMTDKATEYYTLASSLGRRIGTTFADPLNNLGNLMFRQKNYQRAVEFYEKALEVENEAGNKPGILNALTNLGLTFTAARQPSRAQVYLDEALALCTQIQANSFLPALYKAQAENYSNQGKWKEAYQTELLYDEAREKVFGEESTRKISQMELRLSFEEREKAHEILIREDAVKTLELKNLRLTILMIVLAVFTVLGVLNYIFLSRRKIQRKKNVTNLPA